MSYYPLVMVKWVWLILRSDPNSRVTSLGALSSVSLTDKRY